MTLAATFTNDDVPHPLYLETIGPLGATQPLRSLRHLDKLKSARYSISVCKSVHVAVSTVLYSSFDL